MSPGRSSPNTDCVDATLLAARGAAIERTIQLSDLPRLTEWSAGESAQLAVKFFMAERRVAMQGRAAAMLKLTCQRCLGPMLAPVDDQFDVVIVDSETEMDQLPERQEAIIADAARLDLVWLLEEQLLLAMPLVPAHADAGECAQANTAARSGAHAHREKKLEPTEESQRPFAQLRELLAAKKPS